jgi:hypothetical protein
MASLEENMSAILRFDPELRRVGLDQNSRGASMGEVVRFVPRSERERARLAREARAIYDGIFGPTDLPKARGEEEPSGRQAADPNRGDRMLS